MRRKISEWFSIQVVKNPGRMVLFAILLFNVLFFFVAAAVISSLSLTGTEHMGFFEAAFYTVTMILDAGCISFVVADIGQSGVIIAVVCLAVIIIGMISFTGAVIGYVTNSISNFIENSNSGVKKLKISGHLAILNWNTRASEIVNDLLYCKGKQKVVVLADGKKQEILKEIDERLSATVQAENKKVRAECRNFNFFKRRRYYRRNRLVNRITVVVREGDVFSSKQLHDISLERARAVVILENTISNSECKVERRDKLEEIGKGNSQTVKTLMQVSDITASGSSADNQKIIVEITDDWTAELVDKIKRFKQKDAKCEIIPVHVNKILGRILAQFSLMPELNLAFRDLFSNKGATFCVKEGRVENDSEYISDYLRNHCNAIPLTGMKSKKSENSEAKEYFFFSAEDQKDIDKTDAQQTSDYSVSINHDYRIEKKNVIILGHNSKSRDIMEGFCGFSDEWKVSSDEEIIRIVVIDDPKSLEKMKNYEEYPFVVETVPATVYDKDLICRTIEEFVDSNEEDTSILILSDDATTSENIDANALANLVYVQEIVKKKKEADEDFDVESIDVVVEIIDPKHFDIVKSYHMAPDDADGHEGGSGDAIINNNVVISNRYISKMITQIGDKEAIFDFYKDILTYDENGAGGYTSKEVYAKKVSSFFNELPGECSEEEFIRAVWESSIDPSVPENKRYPTVALGYVKPGGMVRLFGRNQRSTRMKPGEHDKVIVFTNH